MKPNAHTVRTQRQLLHLAGLLLALAGLAERAAGCSAPVRYLVLWVLRQGEAVARDHVLAVTGAMTGAMSGRVEYGLETTLLPRAGADEALCLAARFCALAAALANFAERVTTTGRCGIRHAVVERSASVFGLAVPAAAIERRDSS
jgi:hypothetical protein